MNSARDNAIASLESALNANLNSGNLELVAAIATRLNEVKQVGLIGTGNTFRVVMATEYCGKKTDFKLNNDPIFPYEETAEVYRKIMIRLNPKYNYEIRKI